MRLGFESALIFCWKSTNFVVVFYLPPHLVRGAHHTYTSLPLSPQDQAAFFHCTAFWSSRSIAWLQQERELELQSSMSSESGIKHERVKLHREEQILNWGVNVTSLHADRESFLEVE